MTNRPRTALLAAALLLAPLAAPDIRAGRAGQVRADAFRNLAQGVSAYKRGDYSDAIERLLASSNAALNNFRAHYYLGLSYIGARQYPEALGALEVALDLDPGHLMSHVAVGDAFLKMGDLNEANASYFRALKLRPAFPAALDGLGRVYEAQSKDEEAIAAYRQAIGSDRGFAPAYTHLGDLYLRQNRFEEAVLLLEEAVSIRPDFAPGLNRLALAYGRLGLDNQAVATIQRAIELEPNSAQHPAALGELQLVKGYLASAEQSFHTALELDPGLPEARLGLAEVARRRGDYDEAIAEVDRALADARVDRATRQDLERFRALVDGERLQVARLTEVTACEDAAPEDYGAMAEILAGRGLWGEAVDMQRRAGDSAEQRERLAYMLFQSGQFREAHGLYEELSRQSGSHEAAFNDGVTLALLGNDEAAVAAYRTALERDPQHVDSLLYLGNAYLRLGREDDAVEAYRSYLVQAKGGEAAERVRRILLQIAPGAIPAVPPRPTAGAPAPVEPGTPPDDGAVDETAESEG